MRCLKTENQDGLYCIAPLDLAGERIGNQAAQADLELLMTEGSVGHSFKYTIIEMSEDEYKRLPDFSGW